MSSGCQGLLSVSPPYTSLDIEIDDVHILLPRGPAKFRETVANPYVLPVTDVPTPGNPDIIDVTLHSGPSELNTKTVLNP